MNDRTGRTFLRATLVGGASTLVGCVLPGTIYPLLHSLEKKGYLSVEVKREGRRAWREYSATKGGSKVLVAAKRKLRELFHELIE
jgi:PadR family transcriptional regulator PadR